MFPLPPVEAVFIAELFRYFPDAREVAPFEPRQELVGRNEGPSRGVVPAPAHAEESSPASARQVGGAPTLFDYAPRRAA